MMVELWVLQILERQQKQQRWKAEERAFWVSFLTRLGVTQCRGKVVTEAVMEDCAVADEGCLESQEARGLPLPTSRAGEIVRESWCVFCCHGWSWLSAVGLSSMGPAQGVVAGCSAG